MTTHRSDACKTGLMPDYSRAGVVLCRTGIIHWDAGDDDADVLRSGDTVQMVPIPKNAQILNIDVLAKLQGGTLALAGATGCHIGDGASSSRFFDDMSLGNLNYFALADYPTGAKPYVIGYTYDEGDDTIDIAFTKAATVNMTDMIIIMNVYYKMAGSISDEDFQAENASAG